MGTLPPSESCPKCNGTKRRSCQSRIILPRGSTISTFTLYLRQVTLILSITMVLNEGILHKNFDGEPDRPERYYWQAIASTSQPQNLLMENNENEPWDGTERRSGKDRRSGQDRRSNVERRGDPRDSNIRIKKSLIARIRTFTNSRLGVDRRHGDRRTGQDRRNQSPTSLLSQEEIAELLR